MKSNQGLCNKGCAMSCCWILTISVWPSLQPDWNLACLSCEGLSLYKVYLTSLSLLCFLNTSSSSYFSFCDNTTLGNLNNNLKQTLSDWCHQLNQSIVLLGHEPSNLKMLFEFYFGWEWLGIVASYNVSLISEPSEVGSTKRTACHSAP